jgi:circadian clock protein KaiB
MNRQPSALEPVRVRLYLAGGSPNSRAAAANLRAAIAQFPEHRIDLEIIDVLVEPERGIGDGVLVTPMLVKLEPTPERRLLGSLRDRKALLEVLGLSEGEGGS